MRALLPLLLFAVPMAAPAGARVQLAQTLLSDRPDHVAVTIYRARSRAVDQPMDLDWLEGYALITEQRTVDIPAGDATIRFEGVAEGMLPESAIVTGLPGKADEKNRDAALLSPRALLAASTERRVTLRRTDHATGKVSEQDAILRSGPDGAVVMQTREGFEALRCGGLNETLLQDRVPVGLSARPTFSVRTQSAVASRATITLSYLAAGFDWQANYVGTLADDGRTLDLFAWVTLASGDSTSFVDAGTQTVAGRVNREEDGDDAPDAEPAYISLRCWPAGTTDDGMDAGAPPPPPPPPPPMMSPAPLMMMRESADIVVTGSRRVTQEELGDLKLYRVPQPVTVAANSQKQVAMIDSKSVPVESLYRVKIDSDGDAQEVRMLLRLHNRKADRLGIALPAGTVAVFQPAGNRRILLGEGSIDDKAVGETVEIDYAEASSVSAQSEVQGEGKGKEAAKRVTLTLSNARAAAVRAEAEIAPDPAQRLDAFSGRIVRRDGKYIWAVTLPAQGSMTLRYRMRGAE